VERRWRHEPAIVLRHLAIARDRFENELAQPIQAWRGTDSQLNCPNQEANLRGRGHNRLSKSPPAIMLVIARGASSRLQRSVVAG